MRYLRLSWRAKGEHCGKQHEEPFMDLTYAQKMCSFRGRLEIEAEKRKAETHASVDPFSLPLSRVKGSIDIYNKPGVETISTASLCDILGIPLSERKAGVYKRINQIMVSLHWVPIKVRDRRGLRAEHYRGYMRKLTDRPRDAQSPAELIKALSYPLPAPPAQSPGLRPPDPPDVSPEYMRKIAWRLTEDSRHKMARSVEAIIKQRDALLALVEAHNLARKVELVSE
jgi:hypothetical protein